MPSAALGSLSDQDNDSSSACSSSSSDADGVDSSEAIASQWLKDCIHSSLAAESLSLTPVLTVLRRKMVSYAMAVGGSSVVEEWQQIYRYWRTNGCLVTINYSTEPGSFFLPMIPATALHSQQPEHQPLAPKLSSFMEIWNQLDQLHW